MANNAVGLIEQINASSNLYNLASTAYGYCETAAGTQEKVVNIVGFKYIDGVTIHVKFRYGNSVSEPKLNVSSEGAKFIVLQGATKNSSDADIAANKAGTANETTGWQPGAILTLTYDGTNWVRDQGYNTNTTYTFDGTYNSSSNKAATVSTVTNAINALDVDNATSGTGNHITGFAKSKTLATLTETNGIIAATFQDIEIAAGKITSGQVSVSRGGTGASTFTSGEVLIGNGTSAVSTKAIDTTVTANSNNLITSGAVANVISGLTGAMHFLGVTSTAVTDGGTENPTIGGNAVTTKVAGDVVIYGNQEYVWSTTNKWELLGDEGSYALDTGVVHKSDFTAKGQFLKGTGNGTYDVLAPNTTTTGQVLYMKSSTAEWKTLGINTSGHTAKAVTAVAYTANTGTWPTLNKGSGVSITGITAVGTASSATVTDAVLTITNSTTPTAATAATVPKLTDVSLSTSSAAWPTLDVTKTTDFLTGAEISYT